MFESSEATVSRPASRMLRSSERMVVRLGVASRRADMKLYLCFSSYLDDAMCASMMWSTKSGGRQLWSGGEDGAGSQTLHDLDVLLLREVEAVGEQECDCAPFLECFALEGVGRVVERVAEFFRLFASLTSSKGVRAASEQQVGCHVHTEVVK